MVRFSVAFLCLFMFFSCGNNEEVSVNESSEPIDSLIPFDSLAFFNKQIAADPTNTDWLYQRALYTLARGDFAGAKADLEQGIRIDSMDMDVRLLYANMQLSLTHLDTSKFHYTYILRKDSTNTGALIGMSKLYALLDNSAIADGYISAALKIDPHLAEAYFLRGIIYRSDFYATGRKESWDRALSSFQTTVEQDPNYYSAYVEMGVMHDQIKSDLALEYYNSALDIFPESQEALYNVGMYHQTRGQIDEACAAYRKLNELDSTWADPFYNQGYIHLVITGELDSSIYYFTKAVDCDPEYYQALNNLGLAYETKGDIENAKKYYSKAIDANPDFQLAKDNLNSLR